MEAAIVRGQLDTEGIRTELDGEAVSSFTEVLAGLVRRRGEFATLKVERTLSDELFWICWNGKHPALPPPLL